LLVAQQMLVPWFDGFEPSILLREASWCSDISSLLCYLRLVI